MTVKMFDFMLSIKLWEVNWTLIWVLLFLWGIAYPENSHDIIFKKPQKEFPKEKSRMKVIHDFPKSATFFPSKLKKLYDLHYKFCQSRCKTWKNFVQLSDNFRLPSEKYSAHSQCKTIFQLCWVSINYWFFTFVCFLHFKL